ncbi:MAG: RHS repeat protein, partial [Chloroflexi bacterium]|nr:RHS repeat protein [Chloroflexota bacterium]
MSGAGAAKTSVSPDSGTWEQTVGSLAGVVRPLQDLGDLNVPWLVRAAVATGAVVFASTPLAPANPLTSAAYAQQSILVGNNGTPTGNTAATGPYRPGDGATFHGSAFTAQATGTARTAHLWIDSSACGTNCSEYATTVWVAIYQFTNLAGPEPFVDKCAITGIINPSNREYTCTLSGGQTLTAGNSYYILGWIWDPGSTPMVTTFGTTSGGSYDYNDNLCRVSFESGCSNAAQAEAAADGSPPTTSLDINGNRADPSDADLLRLNGQTLVTWVTAGGGLATDPNDLVVASDPGEGAQLMETPDPVSTLNGDYQYIHSDLAIAGRGPSLSIVRAYNSNDPRSGAYGPGWRDNYAIELHAVANSSDVYLITSEGRANRYINAGSGVYTAPSGVSRQLVANGDGSYTATGPDQTKWNFNSSGQLTNVVDRYGNASSLTYKGSGQLTAVSDPANRGTLTFAYDPTSGLRTSVTDWSGRVVKYGYDSQGRLQTVTDRNNQITTYAYDGTTSHLTSITDANGHVALTMTYDSQGRVATQKDAQGLNTGQQTTFSYGAPDGQGNVTTTVTYPTTSFDGFAPQQVDTYNSASQITQHVSKPSSTETLTETYQYNAQGFRNQVTDPRGNTTGFCYDVDYTGAAIAGSLGNLTRTISPPPASGANPLVTLVKYDSKNNVVETVAPKGVANGGSVTCSTNLTGAVNGSGLYVTDMTYDTTLGTELLTVTRKYTDPDAGPQTATTHFAYADAANPGLVTTVTSPRGEATTLTYNASGSQAGLLASVKDPLSNTTSYAYDAVGRRTSLTDPLGNVWNFAYDSEDRLTQATAPAPVAGGATLSTSAAFDAVGNRLSLTDANGQITRYQYDPRDSLAEVDQSATASDPNSDSSKIRTLYSYDALGNLVRVDRAAGSSSEEVVDYAYDGLNRARKEIQYPQGSWPATPDGSTGSQTLITLTSYDANSNRLSVTDPLNQLTSFGYDALNRLTSVSYSNAAPGTSTTPNINYAYDTNGNRTSMGDGTGTTSYGYDELDRLLSVAAPAGTVGYRYDLDGNRTKVIYPDGSAVAYTFDAGNRLQSLKDWGNRTTGYSYFADGLLNTVTNANGTTNQFSYDNARRLTEVWNEAGSNTISQHSYTLDNVGNRTSVAEVLPQLGAPGPIGDGSLADAASASDFGPEQQVAAAFSVQPLAQVAASPTSAPSASAVATRSAQ